MVNFVVDSPAFMETKYQLLVCIKVPCCYGTSKLKVNNQTGINAFIKTLSLICTYEI